MKNILLIVLLFITQRASTQMPFDINVQRDKITMDKKIDAAKFNIYRGKLTAQQLLSHTSILGDIKMIRSKTHFIPFVPFSYEQEYTLVYSNYIHYFSLAIPENYQRLSIQNVFPTTDSIPANILKWYIQFSKPVNVTNIYRYIHFIDELGDTIPRATLDLESPLVSKNGQLLTVWIEPGRQKRGLGPNQRLGKVFEPNRKYSILISKNLKDQNGIAIQVDWKRDFYATAEDRTSPDVLNWILTLPQIETKESLIIQLDEYFDYGSTLKGIEILNEKDMKVEGIFSLSKNEKELIFTPKLSWQKGKYKLIVNHWIEDLAGNNLDRLFDSEILKKDQGQETGAIHHVIFELK